jgi:putative membrane protein
MSIGGTGYNLLLALHIVAMVAWMAGIFYLPRLFVYHAEAEPGSPQSRTFGLMEGRLLRIIMTPAMVATWLSGLGLVGAGGWQSARWLWVKFLLVAVMTGFHFWLAVQRRAFAEDRNRRAARVYRIANEIPTILLILIVILVVVKPF